MNRIPSTLLALLMLAGATQASAQGLRLPGSGPAARAPQVQFALPGADAATSQRQADYIVAVVNSEPITNNEVRARALRLAQQLAERGGEPPTRQQLLTLTLERLITERSQIQYARDNGIKVDEAAIDQAEQSVAAQNQVDVPELRRRVQAEGLTVAQFRDDLRNQVLVQRLRERDLEPRVKITDLEAEQFLQEQKAVDDPAKTEVNLAQLLIPVPENASDALVFQLQARARSVYERARAGTDLLVIARELGDAARASQFGMRTLDRYPQLFVDAVRGLPLGGIAGPVRSDAGFHILKVLEKSQESAIPAAIQQSRARHILLRPGAQLTQEQALQRLGDFRRRIVSGQASFEQLARENSQDGSAAQGGDLGWVRPGQFVPEFEAVMDRLEPGQISDPVVSRFGVHLIQLIERRSVPLSPREQREIARGLLREKRLDETYVTWAQDIRARAYVEMREPPQ